MRGKVRLDVKIYQNRANDVQFQPILCNLSLFSKAVFDVKII